MCVRIAWRVKLLLKENGTYRVKKGQTLKDVAEAFSLPCRLLAVFNGLTEEVREGEVIEIPQTEGNLYAVRGGESKTLLCGGAEAFEKKNGTACLYPTQKIIL